VDPHDISRYGKVSNDDVTKAMSVMSKPLVYMGGKISKPVTPVQSPDIIPNDRNSLPVVIGGIYSITSVLIILFGIAINFQLSQVEIGNDGPYFDRFFIILGQFFVILISLAIITFGVFGVIAGALIAKRRRLGVFIAWGLCIVMLLPIWYGAVSPIFIFYNAACAFLVGIPMLGIRIPMLGVDVRAQM
tara:strand:+ start:63 stop:629 length:567 start_codon:yes stop_codon:yes gene_type:complete